MSSVTSPRHIAFYSAGIASALTALATWVLTSVWTDAVTVGILSLVAGYLVFYFFLEKFIYKKIKVIYKNIYRLKTEHLSPEQRSLDPITEVSNEVFAWAKERREEIASLRKQDNFRRDFIGNMSHELKTPLFNIQGYLHTLLDGAMNDPAVNRRFLEKAAKGADRMAELVEDLTIINKLESGEETLSLSVFNIRDLIEDVYDALEIQAKNKKIKLRFNEGSEKLGLVLADKSQIRQVLTNLIVNGIKYGKEGGTVRCGIYDMEEHYLIEVTDDGDGIDAEHLPRLFERFYRVDKSRSREAGGSGLGLAICKHILESHGQVINVKSARGKGTTFGFTLQKDQ